MKVLKFGGTSVGSPENIKKSAAIILKSLKDGKIAVVVSAFTKITDQLIETATLASKNNKKYLESFNELKDRHLKAVKELVNKPVETLKKVNETLKELENLLYGISLTKELSAKTLDLVMSFGERLSAFIISQSLNEKVPTESLDARMLVRTDEDFGHAKVNFLKTNKNIEQYFKTHKKLQIITGFIGSTENEETTTLGRGGSDYSAAIFGAALNAKEVEIWTDVDGIMTANPKQVKKAFSLKSISYVEAMEMSHFGAKVIHPPTMVPAMKKKIPIVIRNTFNPDFPGSTIGAKSEKTDFPIHGISSIGNIALLRVQGSGMVGIPGVSKRLFGALSSQKINIILISQASSEHSICFAISPEAAEKAKNTLEEEFAYEIREKQIDEVVVEKDLSIIAVVGENMRRVSGIAGKVFYALGKNGINIAAIAQGSSELNISMVIGKEDEEKALNAIHDAFFLSGTKSINLFLLGVGQIGKTLLQQILEQKEFLAKNQQLEIKVIALANTKKMLFETPGIAINNFDKKLAESGEKTEIEKFVKKMAYLNLPNSVFVDCSASADVAKVYESVLKESISIVTPNKKANSSDYKTYKQLQESAKKANVKFLYETTVGAGLPIIGTLNDLSSSGDKVIKIEAVLSGTLSYIFNNFNGNKKFSEIVEEARAKGYTEPDPRDDLNGIDVSRKILILARESGFAMEPSDLEVENLVPKELQKAASAEEFMNKLKDFDNHFENLKKTAEKSGKKLCYIAKLEDKKVKVKLSEVDSSHPFYSLSGSDNIISFTTNRYKERPLVVKGPGAGAQVTAAGVFADIIRIGNYLS